MLVLDLMCALLSWLMLVYVTATEALACASHTTTFHLFPNFLHGADLSRFGQVLR